jgi:hypothetical protein
LWAILIFKSLRTSESDVAMQAGNRCENSYFITEFMNGQVSGWRVAGVRYIVAISIRSVLAESIAMEASLPAFNPGDD